MLRNMFGTPFKAVFAAALAAGLLTGCANASLPSTGEEDDGAATGSGKSRITFALSTDINSTDPYNGTDATQFFLKVFSALTKTDESGKVVGDLAESYTTIDDNTWEFKLRKGIAFHNGETFNAEAVKFSVDRMLSPDNKFSFAADFSVIKEAVVVDEHTVRIVTKEPFNGLPLRLTFLAIVPPQYIRDKGDEHFAKNPVGTGPFRFKEYVKDDHFTLTANLDYFGGAPSADEIVFRPIPEEAARVAALEAGEVDIIQGISSNQFERLQRNDKLEVVSFPTTRSVYIGLDTINNPATKRREFRQALNYAVDVDAIIEHVLKGKAKRLSTVFLPHFDGYDKDIEPYPHDLEKAKSLIRQSGYKNEPLTLVFTPALHNSKEVAEAVASQLREAGVNVTATQKESSLFRTEIAAGKADPLFLFGFGGAMNSPELLTRVGFGSGQRISAFANPEFDNLRLKASGTIDPGKAGELWKELQVKFRDEAPAIFLYQQYSTAAYSKRLQGFKPRMDELIDLNTVSVQP